MSHYKSNLRDIEFNLFEVFGRREILGTGPFAEVDEDTARDMLLGALDDANDYGHVRSSKSERVWATVEDWGEL